MLLETFAGPLRLARPSDATDADFPSRVPTGTEPTGSGVIDLVADRQGSSQNAALLVFTGTDAQDETYAARVIGWRRLGNDPATLLWVPVVLCELTVTLSATTGVGSRLVPSTGFFADTLALVTGNEDVSVDVVSPTGDEVAHCVVDLKGCAKLEVTFDLGTAASANCLVGLL